MALRSPAAARRRQPEVTRDRLLAAAVDLFAERGYDRVRVRDIADRAGVTTGAIYAHYPDMAALLADAAGRAVDHAVQAVAHVGHGELGDALLAAATSTAVGRRLSREQALLLEAIVAARREPMLRQALSEVMRERLDVVRGAVEEAQRDGELRADLSAGALAWFLYLAPIGLLTGRAAGMAGPELDELRTVLEAVVAGLRSVPVAVPDTGAPVAPDQRIG
ncbi:TetR/AcrR family transcriptional regulator [Frankia sp. CNm7]|uniref:TetR/AcrR family transcriptional regulator n=1 Tax=Frankia nepalensis TaxID=1836974 RepID=A0A937UVW7_9ACTN|nr:TetR/AcrR family transcriptional regulator [Frankia nepalensis]MBL7500701.1 TetR/AcrR family transcriptional regulator [Frankia nepalensis]MBL7514472.1 TetR/AcrR family transcriptional regulator [Frankia nepalensis]MBL7523559.1 TetR/AcrR family transcriptional regulator [Frankia nepalensis]MBL7632746.1 TetR/AcrR family transcriptional regulator [Frankia nepalensis]